MIASSNISTYTPSFDGPSIPSKANRTRQNSAPLSNKDFEQSTSNTPLESRPSSEQVPQPRRQSEPLRLGELASTWTKSRRWKADPDANDDGNEDNNDHKRGLGSNFSFRVVPMSGSNDENVEIAREKRIQYWLEDPIRCGYLRAFSQSEVTTMTFTVKQTHIFSLSNPSSCLIVRRVPSHPSFPH